MCHIAPSLCSPGADPGFFPRGGQVGQSARDTRPAFGGTVRRGVWESEVL